MALTGNHCDNDFSLNLTDWQRLFLISARCSTSLLSAIACSVALVVMIYLKLYKWFNYRLVIYLLVSTLNYSIINTTQLPVAWYDPDNKSLVRFCQFIAFSTEYFIWNVLLLTLPMGFQLFSLVMCFEELKSMEQCYLLFSFFFPLLFSWIPLVTGSYGPAGPWCWIKGPIVNCSKEAGIIEEYTLWYGPMTLIMCAYLIAIIMIGLTLCYRAYRKKTSNRKWNKTNYNENVHTETTSLLMKEYDNSDTYKKSLKETVPLLAYPVVFFIINGLALMDRIIQTFTGDAPFWLLALHAFLNTLWGFFAALTLLIHLAILGKKRCGKLRQDRHEALESSVHEETNFEIAATPTATHVTEFVSPEEN